MLGMDFLQPGGCGLRCFLPGNRKQLVALAHHRLLDALRMPGEIEAETPFHAEEVAVDSAEVAVVGANDLMIAHAQCGLAAVGAMRAGGGGVFHLPGSGLVAVGAAGERANRTDVDAHAALFALQVIFTVGDDHARGTAHADPERFHIHALVANAHAAEAKNAARSVVIDDLRPLFLRAVDFLFDETAAVGAVAENHVLQFAFAALVTDRAVQRVIGQQKLQHALARLLDLGTVGANHHSLGRDQRAGGLQLGHFLNFDQAHAASGLQREPGVVAERRNFGSNPLGRFDYQGARGNLDIAVVDFQVDEFLFSHDSYRAPTSASALL